MRISRVRSDPGFELGRNLGQYRVLFNGAPVDYWVTADEEAGMVERHLEPGEMDYQSGATVVEHGLVKVLTPMEVLDRMDTALGRLCPAVREFANEGWPKLREAP